MGCSKAIMSFSHSTCAFCGEVMVSVGLYGEEHIISLVAYRVPGF